MPSANYRESIEIQKPVEAVKRNDLGETDLANADQWETHFECCAEINPRGTREFYRAGILDADVAHQILVRRSSETEAITGEMRLIWNGATLDIVAAFPRGTDRRQIEIHTRH